MLLGPPVRGSGVSKPAETSRRMTGRTRLSLRVVSDAIILVVTNAVPVGERRLMAVTTSTTKLFPKRA
ncbi:hypothetical protein GCM10027176_20130 [Actinoallomurus bryophytorum]